MLLWALFKLCFNLDYYVNIATKGFNIMKLVKAHYPLLITMYRNKVDIIWGRSVSQEYLMKLINNNSLTNEQLIINHLNTPSLKRSLT